jgi:glycosyltransferase involved in cell wall biosynthesis
MKLRYYGHFQLNTGYGHAARQLAAALAEAGCEMELRTLGPRGDWTHHGPHFTDPDAVIVHTLPGDCHRVLDLEGLRRGWGPLVVAYTTWEGLTSPAEVVQQLTEHFDQIWVPSTATAKALGMHADASKSIRVIPHCYDSNLERPQRGYTDPKRFRFYWVGAWSARKNPGGLIRAFALAFDPGGQAELVVHSPGCSMDVFAAALASTGLQQHELPKISLSHQHLSENLMAALHAEADCFVTAARGEAWNLPAFDAILAGRHVISQYGLGSDEFLTNTSADLIDGWETPAHVDVSVTMSDDGAISMKTIGAQGLTAKSLWLEPNLSSLADAMRSAFDNRQRTINVNYNVAERFGYAAVANQVLNVLENR